MEKRPDNQQAIENLKIRPLRPREGYPMIGKGGFKPFRMPDGPVKTLPFRVSRIKPLRGLTDGNNS